MANGDQTADMDVAWQRAGLALDGLPRDDALHLACMNCDHRRVPWVREAYMRKVLRAKCLGRFDLDNPARLDLPWPATVFVAQGPLPDQQVVLMVYMGPEGKWEVVDEGPVQRPDGTRGVWVDSRRYKGNLDGVPGTVNGDDAGSPAPVIPARRVEAPAEVPAPLDMPESPAPASAPPRRTRTGRKPRAPRSVGSVRAGSPSSALAPSATPSTTDLSPKQEILLRLLRLLD